MSAALELSPAALGAIACELSRLRLCESCARPGGSNRVRGGVCGHRLKPLLMDYHVIEHNLDRRPVARILPRRERCLRVRFGFAYGTAKRSAMGERAAVLRHRVGSVSICLAAVRMVGHCSNRETKHWEVLSADLRPVASFAAHVNNICLAQRAFVRRCPATGVVLRKRIRASWECVRFTAPSGFPGRYVGGNSFAHFHLLAPVPEARRIRCIHDSHHTLSVCECNTVRRLV